MGESGFKNGKKNRIKNRMKRAVCAALVLALGLCACGKRADDGNNGGAGGSAGGGNATGGAQTADAEAALAKEHVYRVREIALPEMGGSEYVAPGIKGAAQGDGRIYAVLVNYSAEGNCFYLVSMNEDGSDQQMYLLELPEGNDAEDDSEKENDTEEHDDGIREFESVRYDHFAIGEDGRVYAVRDYEYSYTNENTGEERDESSFHVCGWDAAGRLQWQAELEGLQEADGIYLQKLYIDGEGGVNLLFAGEHAERMRVGADGSLSDRERLSDDLAKAFEDILDVWPGKDNSLLVLYRVQEGDIVKNCFSEYDFASGVLGEGQELGASFSWGFYDYMSPGRYSDLIYSDAKGIARFTRGDEQSVTVMDFVNSDLNITTVHSILELDEKRFFAFYNESWENELKAGVFTYTPPEDIPDRAVITLAGDYISDDMKMRAIAFNKADDTYKIVVKEYHDYSSYGDQEGGYVQLNNDIISGNMPDLLVPTGLPMESYIEKGLIADVNELISEDSELSQAEFLTNVFDAYSVDGKLYYVVPEFCVSTMAAKASLVGDGSDWSLEKMKQVLAGMGENAKLFSSLMPGDDFLHWAMNYCGGDFVDKRAGKCAFDSEGFLALMELAGTMPAEVDREEHYEDDYWDNYETQYLDNRTLMMEVYIWRFDTDLWYDLNGYLGGDFSLVGFPSESGSGAYVTCDDLLALSAVSKHPEGAWKFARYYLTEEYQRNLPYGLPVNRSVFLEKAQATTQRTYDMIYVDGEEVKDEYDQYLYVDGEEVVVPPFTQEQLAQVIAHIESVDTAIFDDEYVMNIVDEEIGGYFSGQKPAAEVAKIIQSRAQLYLQEKQ